MAAGFLLKVFLFERSAALPQGLATCARRSQAAQHDRGLRVISFAVPAVLVDFFLGLSC